MQISLTELLNLQVPCPCLSKPWFALSLSLSHRAVRRTCRSGGTWSRTAGWMMTAAQTISVRGPSRDGAKLARALRADSLKAGFDLTRRVAFAGVVTLDVTALDALQTLAQAHDL